MLGHGSICRMGGYGAGDGPSCGAVGKGGVRKQVADVGAGSISALDGVREQLLHVTYLAGHVVAVQVAVGQDVECRAVGVRLARLHLGGQVIDKQVALRTVKEAGVLVQICLHLGQCGLILGI